MSAPAPSMAGAPAGVLGGRSADAPFWGAAALAAIGLLTIGRLIVLFVSDLNLSPDEAQYWSWSLAPAFGYGTKPPLIAWLIALATRVCGDGEGCVRAAAPIIHAATAGLLYALGTRLYSARVGFWSALTYATLPGVMLSAFLITTDVPLLFFWALALYALHRALTEESRRRALGWAAVLGLAIGLGLLAKYAMVYFIVCGVVLAAVDSGARRFVTSRRALLALALAALVVAPNIAWNLANGGVTFRHTAANAGWSGVTIHFGEGLAFVGDQFAVFGPILFLAFLWWAAHALRKGARSTSERFLLAFSWPVIAIILVQALLSRAHGNWAAPAYVAATPLVVAWLDEGWRRRVRQGSLALHLAAGLGMVALTAIASQAVLPFGLSPFHRYLGWDRAGAEVLARLDGGAYSAIMTDNRALMAELLYYARPRAAPIVIWAPPRPPANHFELTSRVDAVTGRRPLFVTRRARIDRIASDFAGYEALGAVEIAAGPMRTRTLYFYAMERYGE